MTTTGTVREWHSDDGWGVIDSDETPGGCWAHFSMLRMEGSKGLAPGAEVEFTYEKAAQDGFSYRAEEAWLPGTDPLPMTEVEGPSPGYSSSLTITFDEPEA